jgi:hypothetical protein
MNPDAGAYAWNDRPALLYLQSCTPLMAEIKARILRANDNEDTCEMLTMLLGLAFYV